MPLKIIWDFATYWTLTAFLFFQERLCDLGLFLDIRGKLDRIGAVNEKMQDFFVEWHEEIERETERFPEQEAIPQGLIDLLSVEYLYELNRGLKDKLSRKECAKRLGENADKLEELAGQIIGRVRRYTGVEIKSLQKKENVVRLPERLLPDELFRELHL